MSELIHKELSEAIIGAAQQPLSDSRSIPIEVGPFHLERLWIALEEPFGQLQFNATIFKRKGLGWFAITIQNFKLHPVGTIGIQRRVFFAFLPKSYIAIVTRHRRFDF